MLRRLGAEFLEKRRQIEPHRSLLYPAAKRIARSATTPRARSARPPRRASVAPERRDLRRRRGYDRPRRARSPPPASRRRPNSPHPARSSSPPAVSSPPARPRHRRPSRSAGRRSLARHSSPRPSGRGFVADGRWPRTGGSSLKIRVLTLHDQMLPGRREVDPRSVESHPRRGELKRQGALRREPIDHAGGEARRDMLHDHDRRQEVGRETASGSSAAPAGRRSRRRSPRLPVVAEAEPVGDGVGRRAERARCRAPGAAKLPGVAALQRPAPDDPHLGHPLDGGDQLGGGLAAARGPAAASARSPGPPPPAPRRPGGGPPVRPRRRP